MKRILFLTAALLLAASASHAQTAGDPAKGKAFFEATCSGCHELSGPAYTAPTLGGVVGRKAGTGAGYTYTKALAASGIVWSEANLDRFLADPNGVVPGTAMPINVPDAQDRADVIAYLKTQTGH